MESRLTWITQHMAVLASVERHADETIDRRANVTHGIHLLVNDFCRHILPLKQIAVQPAEIAVDIFARLDFLDPVDRSRLAVAKELRYFLSLDFRHLADEVVTQRGKMCRRARSHPA